MQTLLHAPSSHSLMREDILRYGELLSMPLNHLDELWQVGMRFLFADAADF